MNIYNVIILDESGSMSSIYKETLQSINEVLSGIRKNQEEHPEQRHNATLVTFEGNGISGVKTRRDRVPIEKIDNLTEKDYRPGGCTPLYDAMGPLNPGRSIRSKLGFPSSPYVLNVISLK